MHRIAEQWATCRKKFRGLLLFSLIFSIYVYLSNITLVGFMEELHENLDSPVLQIDGSIMTLNNIDARRKTRADMLFASSPCVVLVVDKYDPLTFQYQLELAQAIQTHCTWSSAC